MPKYDDPYAEGPVLFTSASVLCENGNTSFTTSHGHQTDDVCSGASLSYGTEIKIVPDNNDNATQPFITDTDDGAGTYDEPWDLRAARLGLENQLRLVHSSPDQLVSMNNLDHSRLTDPRPAVDYDDPWDHRVVERNLISAKSAKEEARAQREGSFHSHVMIGTYHHTPDCVKPRVASTEPRNNPTLPKSGMHAELLFCICNILMLFLH